MTGQLTDYEKNMLRLLDEDMANHPGQIKPVNAEKWAQVMELVGGVEVDLDAPLTEDEP